MSLQAFSDNLSTLSYTSRHRIPLWVYDRKKRTLFGRTGSSWFLLLLFYTIYYACLAGFFMGMMVVFLHTQVPSGRPSRTGEQSLLGLNPGLGFRPSIASHSSFISFARTEPDEYFPYTQNLDAYFDAYKTINGKPDDKFATCSDGTKTPDEPENVCKFSLDQLSSCKPGSGYGYAEGTPCVILKMNKIFGWIPSIKNPELTNNTLVNCTGQNPTDVENMGPVTYSPSFEYDGKQYGYFDSAYFPYLGQPGYLPPVVGVQFTSVKNNVVILLECQLHNLEDFKSTKLTFELMVR